MKDELRKSYLYSGPRKVAISEAEFSLAGLGSYEGVKLWKGILLKSILKFISAWASAIKTPND